jgi:CRP-like cAMP-binding protein
MERLKAYFIDAGFNAADTERITGCFTQKIFEKGDYFAREGKTCLQMGFVETGMFQYYSVTDKGEERTTYVSMPNSFVASLLTYLTETPSREYVRAIARSELWIISKADMLKLQEAIPAFKDFYIRLVEWQICCIDKAKFDLITLTAEARYEKMLTEEPELLQQVPLQYIASMLAITPRHLSRLRGKL